MTSRAGSVRVRYAGRYTALRRGAHTRQPMYGQKFSLPFKILEIGGRRISGAATANAVGLIIRCGAVERRYGAAILEEEPNLITSGQSQAVTIDGVRFQVDIYRLEHDAEWALEVVDPNGTSIVWDDRFTNDREAFDTAVSTIREEGAEAFMRNDDNVVPFPGRPGK